MMCFKDRTYCSAKTHHSDCGREFTEQDAKDAEKWWGKPGAPIAWSNFCGGDDRWVDGED